MNIVNDQVLLKHDLNNLQQYSFAKDLAHYISIYMFIFCFIKISLYLDNWFFWIIYWWIVGFLGISLLSIAHGCVHGAFNKKERYRHWMGLLNTAPMLVNYSIYKASHIEHHKYTNIKGDTQHEVDLSSIKKILYYFPYWQLILAYWKTGIWAVIGKPLNYNRIEKERKNVIFDFYIILVLALIYFIATVYHPLLMLKVYWGPTLVFYQMAFFFRISEHYGCDKKPNRWANVRTMHTNLIVRYLMLNNNYHAEHHYLPSIPFQNLPILHKLIGKKFKYQEKSYFLFHFRILRNGLQNSLFSMMRRDKNLNKG